jgi:hypothetical protein
LPTAIFDRSEEEAVFAEGVVAAALGELRAWPSDGLPLGEVFELLSEPQNEAICLKRAVFGDVVPCFLGVRLCFRGVDDFGHGLGSLASSIGAVAFGQKSVPIHLMTFSSIQRVGSGLDVAAEGFQLDLVSLAEVGKVWSRLFDVKKPQRVFLLKIGKKLLNFIRGELVNLLADVFDGGTHGEPCNKPDLVCRVSTTAEAGVEGMERIVRKSAGVKFESDVLEYIEGCSMNPRNCGQFSEANEVPQRRIAARRK